MENGFGAAPPATWESGGQGGGCPARLPPLPLDHRSGDIPGKNSPTRLMVPKSTQLRAGACEGPLSCSGPGRAARGPPASPGGAGSPLHPRSAPSLLPVTGLPAPPNDTATGDKDLHGEARHIPVPREKGGEHGAQRGGGRLQDTRLGDAGSRGRGSWGYITIMNLPLPTRPSPPSLPFADLDHPMAFLEPGINPRALAKFWVERGRWAQQRTCLICSP